MLGFHRPGRWDADRRRDRRRARLRARRRAARGREGVVPRGGAPAWDRRDQTGLLRNLVVREGRRTGQLQARLVTSRGDFRADGARRAPIPADSVLWTRAAGVAETTRDGETEVLEGQREARGGARAGCASGSRPTRSSRPTPRWRSGSTASPRELAGAHAAASACSTSSAASARSRSCSRSRPREVWGVELVEEAVADAIENARLNGIDNAQFFAGDVRTAMRPLLEAAGQARRGRGGPAARRPLAEDRAAHARGRGRADRLRLLQPHHARARTPARWSTPATSSRRSGPWTCSRRPRTSSAWRCCERTEPLAGLVVASRRAAPAPLAWTVQRKRPARLERGLASPRR